MSELTLAAVSEGPLLLAAGSFQAALTVVTGDEKGALATFVAVASGARAPRRGRVLLGGLPLVTTPAARRRVASQLDSEQLPSAPSVEQAVLRVLEARGDARVLRGQTEAARAVLAPCGLERWSARRPEELDRDELRSVALALALGHEQAELLVLYEPLATSSLDEAWVRAQVTRAVERGAVVVLVTANLPTAEALGGPHCAIERGVLRGLSAASAEAARVETASTGLSSLPVQGVRPADQLVAMPTSFADPTRPSRGGDP